MIEVRNLDSSEVCFFDNNTVLEYALVYCFTQDCSTAFNKFMVDTHKGEIDYTIYPIKYHRHSISCGSWAVLKRSGMSIKLDIEGNYRD